MDMKFVLYFVLLIIIYVGLSVGENSAIFQYIKKKLQEKFSEGTQEKVYVSRVQSCTSSSAKAVFQHICHQIITEVLYFHYSFLLRCLNFKPIPFSLFSIDRC